MKSKSLLLLALPLVIGGWVTTRQQPDIESAVWLVGTWANKKTKNVVYEEWARTGAQELTGKSYTLKGTDTVVFENIKLIYEKNALFYIPTVKHQNGGKPVRFKLTEGSNTRLSFRNSRHDFPQVITYNKVSADSLFAEISGRIGNEIRSENFSMKKIK